MTDILLQIGATKLVLAVALAGMVWLVTRRVARPAIAHTMWLVVLGAMLVPAVVPLRILPEEAAVEVVAQPPVVVQPEAVPLRVPPEEAAVEAAAQSEVSPPVVVADAGATGDGMAPRGWLPLSGKPLAVLLWLLGSAGFFGWTVVRTVRFQRTLTRAARPAPQLQRLATEIGVTLGLPRVPPVYTTGARVRPLVWWAGGHVRILIPSVLVAELDRTELRAVLAHELAHVRRRDYLVRVVELLACSAYWWNPVVWWAKRKMRSAEESSCDVLAVSASRLTRDRYAKSLLRVVEVMSAAPIPRAPALASAADACRDSKLLEKRLRTVLATAHPVSHTAGRLRVAGAAALALGLSLGLVYCTPGERMAFDQPQLPTPAMSEDSAGIRIVEYAGVLSAQEPTARAYLEPPEVEVGGEFALKIEVTGVSVVEDLILPDRFPFAVAASDHMRPDITNVPRPDIGDPMPYTMEIMPATGQSSGAVTISYALVAQEAGFHEFNPFRIAAVGRTLETQPVMLFVSPRSGPAGGTAQAWVEPSEVKLMERFTLFIDAPGSGLRVSGMDLPDLSGFATRHGGMRAWSPRRPAFYQFVALKSGTHEIGPLTIQIDGKVYETEPVTLVVSEENREIEVHAALNTERALVGGGFALVVEVTGAREFDEDPVLPDVSSFAERRPGESQGRGVVTASRTYHFRALEAGEFEIGPIRVTAAGQTVLTDPLFVTIAEATPDPVVPPGDLRTTTGAGKRQIYIGEPVVVSYQLLARDTRGFFGWHLRDHTFVPPEHERFRVQDLGRQPGGWRRVTMDGRSYRIDAEHLVAVVPQAVGEETIDPAEFQAQVNRREPAHLLGSPGDDPTGARRMGEWASITLATDPVSFEVKPLTAEGRPESFQGQVGSVEVASWLNRTEAVVGDTVTLRVEVSGNAFVRLMPNPEIVLPEGIEILEPDISHDPPRLRVDLPSVRTVVWRLVPTRPGDYRIPAVEVPWFDPDAAEYGVSRAEPFDLTVGPARRE